jgi:acyl-coenzyme A thioesterase PaaI-like protein
MQISSDANELGKSNVASVFGNSIPKWVTSDVKTAFLKGGRQEAMSCKAKVLKLSKRTAYGTVEIHGADSGLLTHHVLRFAKIDREP